MLRYHLCMILITNFYIANVLWSNIADYIFHLGIFTESFLMRILVRQYK